MMKNSTPETEADWVEKKTQQLFPRESWPQVRQLLQEYGSEDWEQEADRVRLALLKLSDGNLEQLRSCLKTAQQDYRDVLAGAEFPEEMTFDSWNLDEKGRRELKQARKRDKQQYADWLNAD